MQTLAGFGCKTGGAGEVARCFLDKGSSGSLDFLADFLTGFFLTGASGVKRGASAGEVDFPFTGAETTEERPGEREANFPDESLTAWRALGVVDLGGGGRHC